MPNEKKFSVGGLYVAVGMILVGMTIGFVLLSLVYDGPASVRLIVYLAYVFIVFFMIRSVRRLASAIREEEEKREQK